MCEAFVHSLEPLTAMADVAHGTFQVEPCGAPCRPHWRSDHLACSVPLPCNASCRKCAASTAESAALEMVMRPTPPHGATGPCTLVYQQSRWQASQAKKRTRSDAWRLACCVWGAIGASRGGRIEPFEQRLHAPPTRRRCCSRGMNDPLESYFREERRICSLQNRLEIASRPDT